MSKNVCDTCKDCYFWRQLDGDWGECRSENANKTVRIRGIYGDYKDVPMQTYMHFGCRYSFVTPKSKERNPDYVGM